MDVTQANIRREYQTPSTEWVRAMFVGVTVLVVFETVRQLLDRTGSLLLGLVVAVVLFPVGGAIGRLAAKACRRATFEAELWKKFGLGPDLLTTCATVELADDQVEVLDAALRDLRSLAAVANHAEADAETDPAGVVTWAEQSLTAALQGCTTGRLQRVRDLVAEAFATLAASLAAERAGDGDEAQARRAQFATVAGELESLAAACQPVPPTLPGG